MHVFVEQDGHQAGRPVEVVGDLGERYAAHEACDQVERHPSPGHHRITASDLGIDQEIAAWPPENLSHQNSRHLLTRLPDQVDGLLRFHQDHTDALRRQPVLRPVMP